MVAVRTSINSCSEKGPKQDAADNFIISTGATRSIREFVDFALNHVGIADWQKHVYIDPLFKRWSELFSFQGSSQKTRTKLGWKPKVIFKELNCMMVDADLERVQEDSNG